MLTDLQKIFVSKWTHTFFLGWVYFQKTDRDNAKKAFKKAKAAAKDFYPYFALRILSLTSYFPENFQNLLIEITQEDPSSSDINYLLLDSQPEINPALEELMHLVQYSQTNNFIHRDSLLTEDYTLSKEEQNICFHLWQGLIFAKQSNYQFVPMVAGIALHVTEQIFRSIYPS